MQKEEIAKHTDYVLKETNIAGLGERRVGKVRDNYIQDDKVVLISTDRHSSFDRIIAHIPFKGQILNQVAAFWFENTKDIVQNHILEIPDPNVTVAKKCKPLPIEVVIRRYVTGVTGTSLWTLYQNGQRDFGSFVLPEGIKKNFRLEHAVITPSTKSDLHDRTLTPAEVVSEGLLEADLWNEVQRVALAIFERGEQVASKNGLILVDTKYEFGLDENGTLTLIDEVHTPDSSRYWLAGSYRERFDKGLEPEYFDKEFLRLWFKENCDPYNDPVLPEAPADLVAELSSRYIQIFEKITGRQFQADFNVDLNQRIISNLQKYVQD